MGRNRLARIRIGALIVAVISASFAGAIALPAWRSAILSAGIALVAGTVMLQIIGGAGRPSFAQTSVFDEALRRPRLRPSRPSDLEALERILGWRLYSPEEFDHRLRPLIVRIARRLVLERHGVDAAVAPEAAAAHLSPRLGSILRGEETRGTTGTPELTEIVRELEALT